MLSIAPLASPDYYLGSSASSGEAFEYFEADRGQGTALARPDPLLRHGKWMGRYADKIGLKDGSRIEREDFESIYYGLDPRDGRPLRHDGKSKEEQQADAKLRAELSRDHQTKFDEYCKARAALGAMSPDDPGRPQAQLEIAAKGEQAALAKTELNRARQKSLRPGSDLVFSAPKSVSMMWAAWRASGQMTEADAIEAAHDKAVRETMAAMQEQFILSRKRDPETSQRVLEACRGIVAAQWRHFDARPSESNKEKGDPLVPDPQLHDHINLFSPIEGQDGKIYAAYTDYARANIKALGAMYRATLSQEVQKLGYRIEREEQKKGMFFKLAGVSKEQANAMSSRAADIAKELAKNKDAKAAKTESRMAKNTLSGDEILEAWESSFRKIGLDPRAAKAATLIGAANERVERSAPDAPPAVRQAMARRILLEATPRARTNQEVLDKLLSMDAHFSLADIRQALWEDAQFFEPAAPAPEKKSVETMDQMVERRTREILGMGDLLKVHDPDDSLAQGKLDGTNRFGEPVFTSNKLRERENLLFGETVPALARATGYGLDRQTAMDLVAKLEVEKSRQIGKEFKLRDFQLRAVMQAACGDGQLCIQIAGAGLGKTTAAQFTKEILANAGRKIFAVAPSNKAASGLGQELGVESSSIHAFLLKLQSGQEQLARESVVFVDEAGMADFETMDKLMGAAKASGAKLILIGDPEQLPAVARGNVLRKLTEMESLAINPDALLYLGKELGDWDKVSRQKHDWAKQASTFFARGYVHEGIKEYERRGYVKSAMTADHLVEDIVASYLADGAPAKEKLILATTNDQVRHLNAKVRDGLKAAGALSGSWTVEQTGVEVSVGDRIVFGGKAKDESSGLQTMKNEFATVRSVRMSASGRLAIECELDRKNDDGSAATITIDTGRFTDFEHAFATTVHKSQGQTVDSVWAAPSSFISRELFYVMASRHRKTLNIHMLEHERAQVMSNAGERIEKRHANDLQAVTRQCSDEAARLKAHHDAYAALMQTARSDFARAVVGGLARVDAAAERAAESTTQTKIIRQALLAGLKATRAAVAGIAKRVAPPEPTEAEKQLVEAASNALGERIEIKHQKARDWAKGMAWLGWDEQFVYARNVATGLAEAWPKAAQEPGMAMAAQQARSIEAQSLALAEAASRKTEKSSLAIREAAFAWLGGPVEIDQAASLANGKPAIGIRAKSGAWRWEEIATALRDAGGQWSGNSWLFPTSGAAALSRLAEAGRALGFELAAPKSPFEAMRDWAWEAISRQIDGTAPAAPNHSTLVASAERLESAASILRAEDVVADGLFVDLFDRSGGAGPERRNFTGFILHQDAEWIVVGQPDNIRALAVSKADLPAQSWPSEDIVGGALSVDFDLSGGSPALRVVEPPARVAGALAPERDLSFPSQAPSAASPIAGDVEFTQPIHSRLVDDRDEASLRRVLAFVSNDRGKSHWARAIEDGRAEFGELAPFQREASGLIVGVSADAVYMQQSDRYILKLPRSGPAFRGLDDEQCLALEGWRHTVLIDQAQPSELMLAEEGLPLAATAEFAGLSIFCTTLRADDRFVWLQAPKSLGGKAIMLDRADPAIDGINHRAWAAMAEGQFPLMLEFDAHGELADTPKHRGSPISNESILAFALPKKRPGLEPELGLAR